MGMTEKVIINAAITGMVPMKADSPHVPISVEEIVADARRCVDAGAAILHLHARDEMGLATYVPEVYRGILRGVRAACPEVILCVSTSGRTHKLFEQRSAVLEVTDPAPEMASLTLGSMNFAKDASMNAPDMIRALGRRMLERGIVPELEVFELGMAEFTHYLIKQGVLQAPLYCNVLLGNLGTLSATRSNLEACVRALPKETTWAAAGIGRFQLAMNTMAIELGGHVRVGLEDNLWFDEGRTTLATNAMFIERLVQIARRVGREIATAGEARQMIGLREPAARIGVTSEACKRPSAV